MASWPEAVSPLDAGGSLSPVLEALIRGPGSVLPGLLLVASPRSADDGTAAGPSPYAPGAQAERTAVALARAWVRTGRRIVLVDLGLEQPTLHERVGAANEEGIADHFEFGTSLERLAQPVDDGAWSLLPAGPFTPEPAAVLSSPEWRRILREAACSETTLLLYAPADAPALASLADMVGAIIDLGGASQVPGLRPYPVLAHFRMVTGQAAPPEAPEAPEAPAAPERLSEEVYERIRLPRDQRSREALIADLRARQRAALLHPPAETWRPSLADIDAAAGRPGAEPVPPGELGAATAPEAAEPTAAGVATATTKETSPEAGLPPAPARLLSPAPAPARRRRPLLYTLIALALLSGAAAAWHYGGAWLDARRERAAAAAAASQQGGPVAAPAPELAQPAADTVLGWAVALEAHQQLPVARQRVATLRAALPSPGFFIAPLVREDALYYHVLAGPVRDSAAAQALLDTLLARRLKTGTTPGDVRHAPLAFLVGDYPAADSAAAREAELAALDIPAYTLPLAGPPPRWRVYAGGYATPAEAQVMRELLRSAGVTDTLVPRLAQSPTSPQ